MTRKLSAIKLVPRMSNIGFGIAFTSILSACSSTEYASTGDIDSASLVEKSEQLNRREMELEAREAELRNRSASQGSSGAPAFSASAADSELLPPNAQTGQCYARVWVEPTYKMRDQQLVVSEASERVDIVPARYKTVEEKVLKTPAVTHVVTSPAVYNTVTEQKLIQAGGTYWKTTLRNGAPVNKSLVNTAAAAGIDIAGTSPGTCYHEHFRPAKFVTKMEDVLVREASEKIEPVDADYRWVEKQVLVSEASTELKYFPAKYKTVKEKVVDKLAHTVWKKGTGPIQKMDEATGEIMCLVEVPATYKTISKQVLVSKAETRSIEVPAKYKTVKVRELVSDTTERRTVVPAEYKQVEVTEKISDPTFVWHEVHDDTMSAESRTGRQICLVEQKPQYQTVEKRIVIEPAVVKKETIPAEYDYVKVEKLVEDAKAVRTEIPAKYKTVSIKEVDTDGRMEWRSILCETNMTRAKVTDVQRALLQAGYKPGKIDGVIGQSTMKAVNNYQRDNNLPVDKYLNLDTLKALGVSAI